MQKMITILGPTASGKTPVAARLAAEIGGEVISADSRQVYRRMDIGTGKDLGDYEVKNEKGKVISVPYHLIDIREPGTKYNLFEYQQDFFDVYQDIQSRGAVPILCGGTGLYIEAVLKGYKLSPVPQNQTLRDSLDGKSLDELTEMLKELKAKSGSNMHNTTDVDSCQRAIRAIEIEMAESEKREEERGKNHPAFAPHHPPFTIIGVSISLFALVMLLICVTCLYHRERSKVKEYGYPGGKLGERINAYLIFLSTPDAASEEEAKAEQGTKKRLDGYTLLITIVLVVVLASAVLLTLIPGGNG